MADTLKLSGNMKTIPLNDGDRIVAGHLVESLKRVKAELIYLQAQTTLIIGDDPGDSEIGDNIDAIVDDFLEFEKQLKPITGAPE